MNSTLLLLPGMMCDARLFTPQIEALSARYSIMLPSLTVGTSIQVLAQNVLAQAPKQFALAGLSMGGIVAMEMLRQAPQRINRLALMDTNPLAEGPERQALREPQMVRVRSGGLPAIMREELIPKYLADESINGAIVDLCMDMAEVLGPDVFCSQSTALRDRIDQREILSQYSGPTLILCGEDDQLCPVARHELMRNLIPSARLAVIPGAGHLPVLEQPERTTQELQSWLNG